MWKYLRKGNVLCDEQQLGCMCVLSEMLLCDEAVQCVPVSDLNFALMEVLVTPAWRWLIKINACSHDLKHMLVQQQHVGVRVPLRRSVWESTESHQFTVVVYEGFLHVFKHNLLQAYCLYVCMFIRLYSCSSECLFVHLGIFRTA